MQRVLVFDIGGTNIRGAITAVQSAELARSTRRATWSFLTFPDRSAEELLNGNLQEMLDIGEELTEGQQPAAVVVGWPGPVTPDGSVLRSPTIFGPYLDQSLNIQARVENLWPHSRVAVMNDLTCAGYIYADAGYSQFCIFTVGSGIANKLFVDGRPVLGPNGRGGEVGHLAAWLPPNCPSDLIEYGAHLGDVASGRGTLAAGRRLAQADRGAFSRSALWPCGSQFDNESLVAAFIAGDEFARRVVGIGAAALAHAIASVHVIAGAEKMILTGGFATALGEPYRRLLVSGAASLIWNLGQDWDAIVELGAEVDGLSGAAAFGVQEFIHQGGRCLPGKGTVYLPECGVTSCARES